MNDDQFDRLFDRAPDMSAALADKIRAQIARDTQPVKPLRSALAYTLMFAALFLLFSIAFAAALKFKGLYALSTSQAVELLLMLLVAALVGSSIAALSMRPASGGLHSWIAGALALLAYEALVLRLFSDYTTEEFLHKGLVCLSLGVLCGVFAGAPLWLIVRRGFVVEPVRAGAAIGLVSGLTGLTFLTLHCDLLTVPHTSLWHAGVILVCVAAGALAGKLRGLQPSHPS
jgi:hypothetical protein